MTRFSVQGGKMNRGLATLAVFRTLAQARGEVLSARDLCRAAALGWCVEWLQAFFLVADDLMDGSVTRCGQPCWYKLPEVSGWFQHLFLLFSTARCRCYCCFLFL